MTKTHVKVRCILKSFTFLACVAADSFPFPGGAEIEQVSENPGGGGTPRKKLGGVCGPLSKTLTLFMTKTCEIPYPIYDLTSS